MREKAACATLNRTPGAYGGAAPASDHLPIARRSARANDHAAKTLLFEVPFSLEDHVEVDKASYENGLLQIDLVRRIPEAMKPRRIEIGAGLDGRKGDNAKAVDQTGDRLRIAS